MKRTNQQSFHQFKNSNRFSYKNSKSKSPIVNIPLLIITVGITFFMLVFVMQNYYTHNPHLYKDYLLQTVPAFEMVAPREEDIVEHSLLVSLVSMTTGINITNPFSLLESQVPAFAQLDYKPVVTTPAEKKPLEVVENDAEEEEKNEPAINAEDLKVAIYHSHTTEAFVPTSGIPHTEKFDETIVKVGEKLKEQLESMGVYVLHDKTYHNQRHSESYRKSATTVEEIVKENDFDLIIDLHRDGVGQSSSVGRPVTTADIQGEEMGKLLFLVGGRHDDWRQNYALANTLNEVTKQKYPGLSRGVIVRSTGNYNQDLHKNNILIEIGGHWNTLEEAIKTTKPLAEIIVEGLMQRNE
ncbi:stage II sporulation protein P [Proteinivorax hydrogeniformans]|uniref:Stage II sporulation protein P n=1 Tax=Proteinivorax hydrogeniformans TaxID=1826727 RepID=A0AAU8HWN5_9FIRM